MFWIIVSAMCAAYYAALNHVAQGQEMTYIWLVAAALFLVLFLYRCYRRKHPRQKKVSLQVRTFCVTSLILCLIMVGVVASRILTGMWAGPEKDLAFIVLLNQKDLPGETDEEWSTRMDKAIAYLEKNWDAQVIVSGGWDAQKGSSEAHAMYEYLLAHGVDGRRVFWEIRSQDTKENLSYAKTISGGEKQAVGIVASDYSMYRTLRIARNQGYYQAEPISAPTTPWLYPHRILQEILHVMQDKFLGI